MNCPNPHEEVMPRSFDRWPELCANVAQDDGLETRDAGPWTEDKLFYWNRYLEITTSAMVGSRKWPGGIIYVDLFGGPGILAIRNSQRRIPGSVLLAASTPKPFDRILVCEKSSSTANACRERLDRVGASERSHVFVGDCNEKISDVVSMIPQNSLSVAFVDPEGLHVHFETLRQLTHQRRVDLLVLFADKMDLHRNIQRYHDGESSNLDLFLGQVCDWRAAWRQLPSRTATANCKFFTQLYKDRLARELDYQVFDDQVMKSSKTSIYRVIFASKSPTGKDFWKKISRIDRGGQKSFDF